ncbi:MAG: winged helix DNA-binding protein [Anaeromicrobium sp.]|jgi:DNA-binding MarR family transcriptional regulator|uniref:MarR family winged helix-turn-helix transcriptional regulator n=1 Tax=Anaeromicrobium sp. TaxID=1929132 RepID=UPI002600D049|nr:winged helix DNA-binding protein [Anaeromicrobium sp.]MCT4594991.1 winged helix DNA-binding protein [Anaeromicrobium sp.]
MSVDCKLVDYDCIALKLRDVISLTDKFYSRKIKELGLPILMNHIPLFYILSDSEQPLAFTDIYNTWEISKSSLSEVINKYHNMGFVEKILSTEDKRSFTVVLTEEGQKIREELDRISEQLLTKFYSNFDNTTRDKFEKNVDHIISNLRDI